MRKPESCSESRMRSRTSREVPEWSGGKDLYMGSLILVAGKVSRFIGIVPEVPKGVRGSTKGVHQPRGATWAVGGAPWPIRAKGTSPKRPMRQDIRKRGESSRGKAPPRCLGEDGLLPGRTLPWRKGQGCAPPLPCPYIYVWGWEGSHTFAFGAALPSPKSFSSPVVLGEAL